MISRILLALLMFATPLAAQQRAPDDLLRRRGFAWRSDTAQLTILHIDSSATAARPDLLHFRLERAIARARKLVAAPTDSVPMHVFMVGSRARMKALTGRRTNGIAYHRTRTVALVITNEWAASAAHEIFHVVAMRAWGAGPTWLNEGMAVYADDQWRGAGLHDAARKLAEGSRLVKFEDLVKDFRDVEENIAYPQAGSFTRYLYERFGLDLIQALWREDMAAAQRIAGRDVVGLEREWRDFLEAGNAGTAERLNSTSISTSTSN